MREVWTNDAGEFSTPDVPADAVFDILIRQLVSEPVHVPMVKGGAEEIVVRVPDPGEAAGQRR